MTHVVTIIEPTQALRDWLRGKAAISSVVTANSSTVAVYAGGLPKDSDLPAIVLNRVGGSPEPLGPVDAGLYQFDCWAIKASDASLLSGALVSVLLSTGTEPLATGLDITGATVTGIVYFPDQYRPDLNRMVVTAQVVTRTST
jgi:hypothetical protein